MPKAKRTRGVNIARVAKETIRKSRKITRADFIGAKMANFLHAMGQDKRLDDYTRLQARQLHQQWDVVCLFHVNNPIVVAQLNRALETGEWK